MALETALAVVRREPLADLPIARQVEQLCADCAHAWRDRLLTPLVTLRLFLLQILHGKNAAQFAALPASVQARLVSYAVDRPGFRTTQVTQVVVATTLMDEQAWPDQRIADLYGQRWQIETCFDHLKTTLKMNVLKCQSVEGVRKELAVYLLAYHLIRLVMLQAAEAQQVSVGRISFADAMRWLAARMMGLQGVDRLIVNPQRIGRSQLRVIRGRLKQYDLLVRPRDQQRDQQRKSPHKKAKKA